MAKTLNPRELMDAMGWRTVQMAMRYVRGDQDARQRAPSRLEKAMQPNKKVRVIPFHRMTN